MGIGMALLLGGCSCEETPKSGAPGREMITVLRVESLSPEHPGAEHCDDAGKNCAPLAPQQKIAPSGVIRTFFGGKVSLDYGNGRRVDLGGNSETKLGTDQIKLQAGDFSLDSTPFVQKEKFSPLKVQVGDKLLTPAADSSTSSSISVGPEESILTVRRGQLSGLFDEPTESQAGQSVRLLGSQIFRTGAGGQELPALAPVVPPVGEFGGLLAEKERQKARGLGTMSARLPNTDQIRDGVVLEKHHVKVVIYDGYARTEIEEEFANTSPHVLEGRYRFPVPGDASLSRLALWVGDDLIEGEVLEKKRAADIYRSIVDRPIPRDPALLEWVTGGEMSLKVFPILPKKTRRVVLAYNQALSTEAGLMRYVYPLSLGEGRHTDIADLSISLHVADSRAKLRDPRVEGYEANVGREGDWWTAQVSLQNVAPSRDFVFSMRRDITPQAQVATFVPSEGAPSLPTTVKDALSNAPTDRGSGSKTGHFALRVSADLPEGMKRPSVEKKDRAIIIDVSQSQSQATILAQGALAYAMLRDMDPTERYVMLACDSACQPYPDQGAHVAGPGHLDRARDFLLELSPGGSSDIAGALAAAGVRLRALPQQRRGQVVLMSDGQASSGDLSAEAIGRRAGPHVQGLDLRIVGAGRTIDEDLLRGLAVALGGTLDPLHSSTSLEERILDLAIAMRKPVLRDVRLLLPSSMETSQAEALPALRLGQELIVTGRLSGALEGSVSLQGSLEGAPYRLERVLSTSNGPLSQNPLVPRLWARSEISRLQTLEETPALVRQIVDLSRRFRTMSRHTSFLVLESEQMYEDFGVARTTAGKHDQPDASFADRRFEAVEPSKDWADDELTSFESLEESEQKAESRALPAAAAAPKSRPKPSGLSTRPRDAEGGLGLSGLGSGGSGRASSSGAPVPDPLWDPLPTMQPPAPTSFRPEPRRAHLAFFQADEAWRSWGEANLEKLNESLSGDPQSRQRMEAFIRGHLQHGRFDVARRKAEEFVRLDPDHAPARELLAYASVLDGDHETARKMLDIRTEANPRDPAAHAQSARSFEVVGDQVRSCAHYRALAELAPALEEAKTRAENCWQAMLSGKEATNLEPQEGDPGQLQIEVQCDAGVGEAECPSPVAVAPDGQVLSPWTPGTGKSSRRRITFVKLRSGDYHILVLGGSPEAKGKLVLTGRQENKAFRFEGGSMHTIAKTTVAFW